MRVASHWRIPSYTLLGFSEMPWNEKKRLSLQIISSKRCFIFSLKSSTQKGKKLKCNRMIYQTRQKNETHRLCDERREMNVFLKYRVLIKYCVFSDFFEKFRTLFSFGVSLCTQTRQVENQRCSRTRRVQKNHNILRKKHNI